MNDSDEHARRFREAAHQIATDKLHIKLHMWKCMNCGKENRSNRDHCWNCGTKDDGTLPENPENFSLPDERSQHLISLLSPK